MLVPKCFANYFSYKSKQIKVVWLNSRLWIGVVSCTRLGFIKQGHIFVQHFFTHQTKPFLSESTLVNTVFAFEFYPKPPAPSFRRKAINLHEAIRERAFSADLEIVALIFVFSVQLLELRLPYNSLCVEFKDLRNHLSQLL